MRILLVLLLFTAVAHAAGEVVPAERIIAAASDVVFGGAAPSGWRPSFRIGAVPVGGTWSLRAEKRQIGDRVRTALVAVIVGGRAVRRIPVVFTVSRGTLAGARSTDAAVHRGESVTVVSRHGGVACCRAGEALGEGRVGEPIRVRCGRRVLEGRVSGTAEVEVGHP
jgi:hypothetical protein